MTTQIRDTLGRTFASSPVAASELERLRAAVLVPHGVKCPRGCGATLVPADPLPHRCDPMSGPKVIDYGGCLL